jgi:hypothetical protein
MRTIIMLALAAVLTASFTVLAAEPDAATAAAVVDPKLARIALHATAIAGALRLIVLLLKSPLAGLVWMRFPLIVKAIIIAVLTALAVAFDSIALGTPVFEALFTALGGVVGGIAPLSAKTTTRDDVDPKVKPAR